MIHSALVACLLTFLLPGSETDGPEPEIDVSLEACLDAIDGGVRFLVDSQNEDGSWGGVKNATFVSGFADPGTYKSWTVATTGLATKALLSLGKREEDFAAMERGLDFLMAHARLVRPAEWDVDNVWGLIYGLDALSWALIAENTKDPEVDPQDPERIQAITAAAHTMIDCLERYQSPRGGWGYYAGADSAWRPEWATSFTTAAGIIALAEAKRAGLDVPEKMFKGAVKAVRRCRLPNGAYEYSVNTLPRPWGLESINQVKGSIGRIQVCNYALVRAGVELPENALADGLAPFFKHHKFFDVARNKTIPHESYYAVAAYFYLFGHYYAAQVYTLLPQAQRLKWRDPLCRGILKCRQKDGSFWDFWIASCTRPYGTAFSIMALGSIRFS